MLTKQTVNISFLEGLDTKTDPYQVDAGKFLALSNSVFSTGKRLTKRSGFPLLTQVPSGINSTLTTFNGDLTSIGNNIWAYSDGANFWKNQGSFQSASVSTLPAVRNSLNQVQCDVAIASNNIACIVYAESTGSTTSYKWTMIDSVTGQSLMSPTLIAPSAGTVTGNPKVFLLGNYFIIVFTATISSVANLEYFSVGINNLVVGNAVSISAVYTPGSNNAFDGYVSNNNLYLAWNGSDTGGAIRATRLDSSLTLHNTQIFSGYSATTISVSVDETGTSSDVYISFYSSSTTNGYVIVTNQMLVKISGPTQFISSGSALNLTSVAQNGSVQVFVEVTNNYGYDNTIPAHYIATNTISASGTVGTASVLIRSVGLATKAALLNNVSYFLAAYQSTYQPTYFLINGSGQIIAKIAYENGAGYVTQGLGSLLVSGTTLQFAYLYKDLVEALNTQSNSQQTTAGGIYTQTGINLGSVTIGVSQISTVELGNDLLLSGGFLWMYDGQSPVEQSFFLFPDNVEVTASTTGGNLTAQQYYYQVTYEWCDNQGNIYRSAPSIPVSVTTTGSTSSVTINVPSLRLTYKTINGNFVKIVVYRWSASQQNYFQVTSVTTPIINPNVLTTDYVTITDTLSDSAISGNNLIYTTGGVVENINPPASNVLTHFDSRLWLVDAEDQNLLWYSKPLVEATPVEMSDLLTYYIDPNLAPSGNTGPVLAASPMDDKLVLFKKDAIFYINGTGPDSTGANSQYSQPIFITSTVGCSNQNSIVFIPQGLLFQSDKGIWLLGRDLSTNYIGAPVDAFNSATVLSAVNIPQENQVRFTLDSGTTLQYDYFYNQWGSYSGIPGTSSTIYNSAHTYLNSNNQVFQETAGTYLDYTNPVLMSFTTSWLNFANIQGYQRAFFFYLLGTWLSPHKLLVQIAYDYNSSPTQTVVVSPNNYSPNWGQDLNWGSAQAWGGPGNIENWKINLQRQKCEAFQITVSEIYDPTYGVPAGAGFTLSGINVVVGIKKGYRPIAAALTTG